MNTAGESATLYARISRELRHQIITGRWPPGRRVATEKQLSEQYGVSVLTVRQAQQVLVDEGLIAKQQGRGTFVTDAAESRRRAVLVCGLNHEMMGPTPYFLNSIQLCQQAAARSGLRLDTMWVENFPADPDHLPVPRQDEVGGFVFLACVDTHPLLQRARALDYHYVNLGKVRPGPSTVWFDPLQAARMARSHLANSGAKRVFVVSLAGTEAAAEAICADDASYTHLRAQDSPLIWTWERRAYELARSVCTEETTDVGFVFLDDIVARGGTRALLEAGVRPDAARVCVVCGRQEAFPYGVPVIYVTHDTAQEAEWAIEMLLGQLNGEIPANDCRQSEFRLAEVIEWHEAVPEHLTTKAAPQ